MQFGAGMQIRPPSSFPPDFVCYWNPVAANRLIAGTGPESFSRSSTAYEVDPDSGLWVSKGTNVLRLQTSPLGSGPIGALIEQSSTNLYLNSDTLATQDVTVTANPVTVSFEGTGTITFSGVYSGSLVGAGTGPENRVSKTFTPTAGTLTSTVSGSVTKGQCEQETMATSYIPTTSVAVTRAADALGIPNTNVPTLSNGCTIACRASVPNDGEARYIVFTDTTYLYQTASGTMRGRIGNVLFTAPYVPDTSAHVYALRTDGTTHDVFADGVLIASVTGALTQPTTDLYIGSTGAGITQINSPVGPLLIFNRALNDSEIASIQL